MSKHYPWFKFNPADWLTNIDLRSCSCAARGTLVDLMCLAHRHESYGTIMSFDTPSDRKKIAKSLSISIRTFDKHLADLLQMQRICVSNDGHMYIKRMINDHAKASKDSKNGSKGGNPAVMGVNPPLNPDKNRVEEKRIEKKTPISPKEGGQVSVESPKKRKKASKDMTAGELKKLRVKENTKAMKYIGALFGRGENTRWNQYEAKALQDIGELVPDEVNLIGRYYRAKMEHGDDIRRRNVETLLNNWMGELDRAALWERNPKPKSGTGQGADKYRNVNTEGEVGQ